MLQLFQLFCSKRILLGCQKMLTYQFVTMEVYEFKNEINLLKCANTYGADCNSKVWKLSHVLRNSDLGEKENC